MAPIFISSKYKQAYNHCLAVYRRFLNVQKDFSETMSNLQIEYCK